MNPVKSLYKFLSPKYQSLFLEYKVDLKPRYGFGKPPNEFLDRIIEENREPYATLLETFLESKEVFHGIKTSDQETNDFEPRWNNGYGLRHGGAVRDDPPFQAKKIY